jgi:hypothetical protein
MRRDRHLFENNLGERCIASRLAMHLQNAFPEHSVDAEYNRAGDIPKKLGLPPECANSQDDDGQSLAVPDVIVHRRGPEGPNLLVLEVKKPRTGTKATVTASGCTRSVSNSVTVMEH